MAKAIAAFERTVVTGDSPYDMYLKGDRMAMSKSAMRGMHIFSGKGHCSVCHSGPAFSDSSFHNLGAGYSVGKYKDVGRYEVTKNPNDMGAFLTQRLRNVALTPPYMHDGSEPTLEAVVEFYNRGGIPNPNLDQTMVPLNLSKSEKKDLVAFMEALTGPFPITEPPVLPNSEITAQQLSDMMKEGVR
jgi:cytochrome c peroxidase